MHFKSRWSKQEAFIGGFPSAPLSHYAVSHVQIAVTCETDQLRGNLGASIRIKENTKLQ